MDNIGICATGIYEPAKSKNVKDVEEYPQVEDKIKKLGIRRVRIADNEHPSDMAIKAALNALDNCKGKVKPEDIDMVVYSYGLIPDHLFWADYAEIQYQIGAVNANSLRMHQACNGEVASIDYVYAKMSADKSINMALVVGADKSEKPIINRWTGANTAFYGDGASAAIIKRGEPSNTILGTSLATDGTYNRIWQASYRGGTVYPFSHEGLAEGEMLLDFVRCGGQYQTDDNMRKLIVKSMVAKNKQVLTNILEKIDVDVKINKVVTINLGKDWIRKVMKTMDDIPYRNTSGYLAKNYGHMGAADLIFNLHKMQQHGKIKSGDDVVLFSSGAGYSAGCVLIRYF